MCFAPLFEKFMQAIFQTKKKSSLFFIRFAYAQHLPPKGKAKLLPTCCPSSSATPP